MASSGSYDYSVTAANVIDEMAEQIGLLAEGETITTAAQTSFLRTLNMMVKQWSGNFDFAPGLKAFARKTGYMFLQANQGVYTLGPSGDNATLSYVSTTMRVAGASTDTILEVTSTAGMTSADYIGVELDSGSIYWTTISSVTDGDTLVLTAGLTGASSIGKRVFTYTTKLVRPLYVENASLRNTSTIDTPLSVMTKDYYESLPDKTANGTPIFYRYDNTLTNGTLYLDSEPTVVSDVLRLVFYVPAEDYDAVANDIAFPQEWYLPLALGLGKLCAMKTNAAMWTPLHESNLQEALAIARGSYAETTEMYFQPGLE